MRRAYVRPVIVAFTLTWFASFAAGAPPAVVHEPWSEEMEETTRAFWTRDRIATAPALRMPIDTGRAKIDAASLEAKAPTGPEGSSPPGRPEPGSDRFHREFYPLDWADLDVDWGTLYEDDGPLGVRAGTPAGTTQIFTFYDVNVRTVLWKIFPHRYVGKLTFKTPDGTGSCSATAISKNHIVTAAHCVFDTPGRNQWYENKIFTPAYRNGSMPYGKFATTGCSILAAWQNLSGSYSVNGWARHDVAVCDVGKNAGGKTLTQAVGWAGRSWDFSPAQLHFNAGYPGRDYTDKLLGAPAQYLRSCTAESFLQTTNTVGSGCFYGRGISGGPWLKDYKADAVSGLVNSVNSGLFLGTANNYGPRFTSQNIKLLCDATGC